MSQTPGLLDLRLVFVTGKGGVGKTTVAAGLAQLAAEHGKRVLVCEVDAKGDVTALFEAPPADFTPREVAPGVWSMSMDTEASLREYLKLHLRIPVVGRIGPLAKAFDFVATAAPGVREILTVGKFCWEVRESHYDLVVVDASASGHIIGQLAAPQAINDLVKVGLIRSQTDWMLDMLSDPRQTGLVAVCTPEEMPVNETLELVERVRSETTVRMVAIVVNRVLPELFGQREEEIFEQLREPRRRGGPLRAGRWVRRPRARGSAAGGDPSSHPFDPPAAAAGGAARRPPRTALAVPVRPQLWRAHDASGGARARRGARTVSATSTPVAKTVGQLLAAKDIVIACGPGGVGKTTTAAALAATAVVEQGGRVLVVTVDPARRLADALGLKGIGNDEVRIPDDVFTGAAAHPRGELWAAMLDTKQSWDDLVRRHAPDAATREKIIANPLYQNISARFVQSHDYIAMERLYEIHSEGKYDLIVVDTPPTRNALDFLDAPQRMADFFSSRLLRWLIVPYRSRLVNVASRPFYQVADRILGTQFLADISEFFVLFQSMYSGFVERAEAVTRLLSDRRTTFMVVSTLEATPVREAEFFSAALTSRKLHLGAVVLNKVLPEYLRDARTDKLAQSMQTRSEVLADGLTDDPVVAARVVREVAESFLNFGVVARREAEQQAELRGTPDVLVTVPFYDADIYDIGGLLRLGAQVWG